MIRPAWLLLTGLLFIATQVAPARADRKEEAHAAEARGDHGFGKAEYAKALVEYQASYKKYPKPYMLFRIGECQRLLKHNADAVATYKKYVARVAKGADRKKALEYIAALRGKADEAEPAEAPTAKPAPQQNDVEAPPMSPQEIAKKRREMDNRDKKGITAGAIVADGPHLAEPLPPGFDPANLRRDPHDPKVAPPPEHFYPVGYKPPVYRRWWPWTLLAGAVVIGAGVGLGLAFGLPKFNSELPIGGPGAHALTTHGLTVRF